MENITKKLLSSNIKVLNRVTILYILMNCQIFLERKINYISSFVLKFNIEYLDL